MGGKIDLRRMHMGGMGVEIVELGAAGAHLQPIDAAITPVIRDNDSDFDAKRAGRHHSEFIIM